MIVSGIRVKLAGAGIGVVLAAAPLGGVAAGAAVPAQAAGHVVTASPFTGAAGRAGRWAGPAGRAWPSFAYDPPRHEFVLFGGDNGSTVFGDTWIRKSGRWVRQNPARSPLPRTGAAMVYDDATGQLLLFGGSRRIGTAGGFLGDTWIWTGRTWRRLRPALSPPARHNADVIYDAATGTVVMFGGYDGRYLGDTWIWNGTTWTRQATTAAPAPRDTGSFVFDAATGTAILYGGFNSIAAFTDTWTWAGTGWTQLSPAASPGPVTFAWDAAYDAATGQVVLFGGGKADHTNGRATWQWNGITWTRVSPATGPQGRGVGSMTYDGLTGQIVLFGGQGPHQDTYPESLWSWDGSTWGHGASG